MALPAPVGDWNDEQKALRKGLAKYYEALNAGVLEDDAAERFNRDKWQLIRESGVIRIPFAEQWGGLGHDPLTLVYVLEELGYGCRDAGLLFALATQVVSAAIPLQKFGSDDLKERYLARLIAGEIISAHAISEPSAGSDAMAMSTTATPDGDAYVLNGGKTFITNGPIADVITVYAKLESGDGASGITAFLVPTDTPGFHVGPPIAKLGLNTCPFCELEFTDCRVPADTIVGKPGAGFFILEHVMNWEILCIFMMMAGEMQERMERCIAHVKKRTAFGVPIASNQYVAGKIVDQKIGIETSRKHLYDTARRFAKGRSVTTEISMAKLVTSEANLASALSAVQLFGGRGYMREYGMEKGLRDAIGAPIYSGTNEMQRVRIASMLGL
ncbi:MAG TPA: acyl-CoA dehydrogenase family protein [Solirubrobacteraceae bacterium]|jgi:alkylation response protein AidB-like acyl-CoA dehydrogenase|nr:acyl-CoA dehydrogenase family protein [Solirubrobacteraceae bacterium]